MTVQSNAKVRLGQAAKRGLRLHPGELSFARLAPGSEAPEWARDAAPLSAVSWSADETSVLAPSAVVPAGVDRFGPWRAFEVEGPVDFLLTGVLHSIISPLAAAQLAVTTISTYKTDWVLLPADQVDAATNVWRYHGFTVTELQDDATAAAPTV